jgi:hypothetical protein
MGKDVLPKDSEGDVRERRQTRDGRWGMKMDENVSGNLRVETAGLCLERESAGEESAREQRLGGERGEMELRITLYSPRLLIVLRSCTKGLVIPK